MDFIEGKSKLFETLTRLRSSNASPAEFWSEYLDQALKLVDGAKGSLLVRSDESSDWRRICEGGSGTKGSRNQLTFTRRLKEFAGEAAKRGFVLEKVGSGAIADQGDYVLAIRLVLSPATETVVLAIFLAGVTGENAQNLLHLLRLIADIPESYQLNQSVEGARGEVQKFATVMDLLVEVNEQRKIQAGVLAVCNGIAGRYKCERVSFGWLQGGYIKLLGMSRVDRVDHKTEAARMLEAAMEEACDQDEEIVFPVGKDANYVSLAHEKLAGQLGSQNICSLPMRDSSKPVAAVTCERNGKVFSDMELDQLRLATDLLTRQMVDLKRYDRWFGARWAAAFRESCGKLLGPKNTWAKIFTLTLSLLLAVLIFVKVDYRVEAKVILRSDEVAYITVPFDGYIDQVLVKAGDPVAAGDVLLRLNTDDLLLQKSTASADLNRYRREIEKARAARELANMRISEALAMQAQAQLELVEYRLSQSVMKSGFDGIIVEGDLRQRLGAPVKQGESLFRLARMDSLYLEAQIEERDYPEVIGKEAGEVAFLSQPKLKYPIKISQIESAATPREVGNIFIARCDFSGEIQDWWRPGMSGLCKLSAGRRTLIWIFSHRTIDFLRMWFWW